MGTTEKVLLVDDDPTVRRAFRQALTSMGYAVGECGDGLEMLERIEAEEPSLIVLDVDMPRMDGWESLAELRQRGWKQPVLMVTHVDDVDSRVRGLDAGADDYIGKPCSAPELIARVRALLRRAAPTRTLPTTLRFGEVLVDLARKTATCRTGEFRLTRSEFALLTCLLKNIGTPVPREVIFEQVWGSKVGKSHTLDTHLWRLRKKLGDTSQNSHWICNHAGIGYSLAVEVANAE